ncbi:MAG: carboxypeptidase-like regulatory domain-containing protein [Chitinophagaceae bacterium]|nr:carboxypeptidase-like regulatory domain-containing protein [Chitinophagaceae bacterium]
MSSFYKLILFPTLVFCVFITQKINAQQFIEGTIKDAESKELMANVNIQNVHNKYFITTDSSGKFRIEVKKDQLIEFRKIGYQTLRFRMTTEPKNIFYALELEKERIQIKTVDIKGRPIDYKKDSIKYAQEFDFILRSEKKSEVNMSSMPLAMLSKKNRECWKFMNDYEDWQNEKFIDFAFNENLVRKITYLDGEALRVFMINYRPSVQFLRSSTEYEYLDYIKKAYRHFQKNKY